MTNTTLNAVILEVTASIADRSRDARGDYLGRMRAARLAKPARARLSCSNLAHVYAASGPDKQALRQAAANIGIVTAYNDMLSAHQPFERYPEIIRAAARGAGATAQVAGGVPAMCDGVTQGRAGMELSLLSRDVIALSTALALSHDAFDAALLLGVCDKIVPGLFIGAAVFGHLPVIFVPAGPMSSGIDNRRKAEVRQRFAEGLATREELLAAESAAYHDAGTCTFYGTANSNQMLMELMGLHVPGTAFVNPGSPLRHALTVAATRCAVGSTALAGDGYRPFFEVVDERSFVNGLVGLMATGGSTNHTMHLIAMARAVGLIVTWQDMSRISGVTPLIARVYPNGQADVNQFHAAGGMAFVVRELLRAGLVHDDVNTVWGRGLAAYAGEPFLKNDRLEWRAAPGQSLDASILRPCDAPFAPEGGLRLLTGNLGEAVIKTSAVDPKYWQIEAPARVFENQEALGQALASRSIEGDFIAVIRGQGPRANGMPELHQLLPALGALLARGRRVAIVTDGRMSGASGKVPAAIHLTPEALDGGPVARLRDGDLLRLDASAGQLEVLVEAAVLQSRVPVMPDIGQNSVGTGRELFARLRAGAGPANQGASILY
jgi:phosphogluconate dehydratase